MQAERVYSVLLVSAAEKMNTRLETFFAGGGFESDQAAYYRHQSASEYWNSWGAGKWFETCHRRLHNVFGSG